MTDDLQNLRGVWKPILTKENGSEEAARKPLMMLHIEGDTFIVRSDEHDYTWASGLLQAGPRELEFHYTWEGRPLCDPQLGIYLLEEVKLTIAKSISGAPCPVDFDGVTGHVTVYHREAP